MGGPELGSGTNLSVRKAVKLPEKVVGPARIRSFKEIELEVEAEGREWMRKRLQEKLQAEADRARSVFPPQRSSRLAPTHPMDARADGGRPH